MGLEPTTSTLQTCNQLRHAGSLSLHVSVVVLQFVHELKPVILYFLLDDKELPVLIFGKSNSLIG